MKRKRLPLQPVVVDDKGVERFQENAIVRYILDNGRIDLNHLAIMNFRRSDREQFAQLIGYSLDGFAELDYVRDYTFERVKAKSKLFKEAV